MNRRIAALTFFAALISASTPLSTQRRLGSVDFKNTGASAAQAPFQEGIALLHSFVYDDAAASFRAAQKADPSFALSYWFEALTYSHPLWNEEDLTAARAALQKLGPDAPSRLAKAPDARSRAYGEAIEGLFGDGDAAARAQRFGDGMRRALTLAPDDDETLTFTSLALMGTARFVPIDRQPAVYAEAETLAARVFARHPNHPGAAHYVIHADDAPDRAGRALTAARAYARIAPDAVHALHMPAHTFVQLGLWDEASDATEHAWRVSRAQVADSHESAARLSFHDLLWIVYVDAQQGRYRDARRRVEEGRDALATADLATAPPPIRYGNCFDAFAFVSETGDWSAWAPLTATDRQTSSESLSGPGTGVCRFDRAVALAMSGHLDRAKQEAEQLRSLTVPLPAARARRDASVAVLEGLLARAGGDRAAAIAKFTEAAEIENTTTPLGPQLLPSEELLGAELLAAGRAQEAVHAYEVALSRGQNRSLALLGLARARTAAGDAAGAREAYTKLADNWRHADPDLPALAEVHRALGAR